MDGGLDKQGYEALRDTVLAAVEPAQAELARMEATVVGANLPALEAVLVSAGTWQSALALADVGAQRDVLAVLWDTMIPPARVEG